MGAYRKTVYPTLGTRLCLVGAAGDFMAVYTYGRFNLVLAVDDLNDDVKRIVEFTHAHDGDAADPRVSWAPGGPPGSKLSAAEDRPRP